MSLLTMCQDAAVEIGIETPTTIIGNSDADAAKLLRYAKKVSRNLMKAFDWQDLVTTATGTASTYSGVDITTVDADFDRFVPETMWDTTNDLFIKGPVSLTEFRGLSSIASVTGTPTKFAYRRKNILFYPTLSGDPAITFDYVSAYYATDGTAKATYTADADTSLLDEELITLGVIIEFNMSIGQPADTGGFVRLYDSLTDNERPGSGLLSAGDVFGPGRNWTGEPPVAAFNGLFNAG